MIYLLLFSLLFAPAQEFAAPVVWVVDGDTIHVMLEGTKEKVRVIGINSPEKGKANYNEAKEFTRRFVGKRVVLVPGSRRGFERDQYGRLLAYVENSKGEDLGAELVRNGLAWTFTRYPCSRTVKYLWIELTRDR
jgi:micrococcal nuclease